MFSLIVPLFRSEANLGALFPQLEKLSAELATPLEVVFVVDGSPDRCAAIVTDALASFPFASQVVDLSRNFGAFAAIAAGLRQGTGQYFAVLAADLQEPPQLIHDFYRLLSEGSADIVVGQRSTRSDPILSSLSSRAFWWLYRKIVSKDFPAGGVDVFGCTRQVRDAIVSLQEVDSSLVALLFWVGFRRAFVPYERRARTEGKSAWTFRKKLRYAVNSIFNFTDLPVRLLLTIGVLAVVTSLAIGIIVIASRIIGRISVPGYTPILLSILFFGGVTSFGLGILGQYLWITLQNVRNRPLYIVRSVDSHIPTPLQHVQDIGGDHGDRSIS